MATTDTEPTTSKTARVKDVRGLLSSRWVVWCSGLLVLSIAVWFRVWNLGHLPGINGDEAWYGVQAMSWLRGETVSWSTPTGNPLNPFYFLPLTAVHAVWGVGVWQLRCVAAVSGIVALLVNYILAKRAIGSVAAAVSTLVLAVLPINLAYSRFGWDASQTLLFALPVLYCPLIALKHPEVAKRWLVAGLLFFIVAVMVHPTNVFLLPLLVVPAGMNFRGELTSLWQRVDASRWRYMAFSAVVLLSVAVSFPLRYWVMVVATRIATPSEFGLFVARYVELLSGVTVYRFIPGSLPSGNAGLMRMLNVWLLNLGICGVICLSIFGWLRRSDENMSLKFALLTGWSLTVLGFFLVAGPGAIAPHFERYGICLIAPTVLVLSWGLGNLISSSKTNPQQLAWGMTAFAVCSLIGFYTLYFEQFRRTGGESHRAFRTAEQEPKESLLQQVRMIGVNPDVGSWAHTTLATSEWWTYWPLRYLSIEHDDIEVVQWNSDEELRDLVERSDQSRILFVEFVGQSTLAQVREGLVARSHPYDELQLSDAGGLPLLTTVSPYAED